MVNIRGLDGTASFKRSFKRLRKQGKAMNKLFEIAKRIEANQLLPKDRDHALQGQYKGNRECHIEPDWVLVYFIRDNGAIFCIDTGTHSDIFGI